jgi:polysaccharide chain length determinant protein (PEP-CTERM system associated)
MQELLEKVLNELRGAWRFRRHALVTSWGVCLLGWLVVYSIPDTYEAHARVNVDTRTALRQVVQGLAVDQDVEAQLNLVRQSLMGRANLEKVVGQAGFDMTAKTPAERDAILNSFIARIDVSLEPPLVRDPRIPNTLYRLSYRDEHRETALKVVDVLLNSFVEDTMGTDRTGTANAEQFLREQLADYGRRLAEAEASLAEFKKKNMGMVPGGQGDYFQRLGNENSEVRRLESAIAVAESRRAELNRQLRGEVPYVPQAGAAGTRQTGAAAGNDTATRIQETQARLDEMLLRFTDRHPDVIAARETLVALKKRQEEEIAALRRGDVGAAAMSGAASNPVYQSIQLQMNQVEVELAALRGQMADHRRAENQLRQLVDTVPEVEAEYSRLMRDYDVTKAQYNALLERLERAKLSGEAEATGVVKFNVIDPPSAGFSPIFPNRPLFIIAVLFMGIAAGAGLAYVMHLIRPVFSSRRELADATGVTVLGAVTRTWLDKYSQSLRMGLLRYAVMTGLLIVVFLAVLVLQRPGSLMLQKLLA